MAFTAVLLLRPQDQIPGLRSVHLAEICALIGLGPMFLHRLSKRRPLVPGTPEIFGLVVFGFAIIGTVPFSIWPGGALEQFTDSYLKALAVCLLMMNTLTTPKRLERIAWLILLCIGYIALRGVVDYMRGMNLVEGDRLSSPIGGIFGNPNDLALNMVAFIPSAAIVALSRRYPRWKRGTAAIVVALMLAVIVFTKSRGGMLGLVVMLAVLVVLGRKIRPGFGAVAIAAILAATPLMPSSFWLRMITIVDAEEDQLHYTGSREARRVVMQEGIEAFFNNPFTGVGAGQFKNYNPPGRRERWRETHNAVIQVAAETGMVGLAAFLFLIVRAIWANATTRGLLKRATSDRADDVSAAMEESDRQFLYAHTVAMTAGLVGWLTCAMFASVAYSWTFYYLLALSVCGREMVRNRLLAWRAAQTSVAVSARPAPARFGRMATTPG